jgi:hypothetical protein
MTGFIRKMPYYFQYGLEWPSIEEIMSIFQFCKKSNDIHVIKFEELHYDNESSLTGILNYIHGYSSLLSEITSFDLEHAKKLGSFEYQTQGKKTRGAHNNQDAAFYGNCIHTPSTVICRRGVIGDWKNLFSKDISDLMEEKCMPQLQELGYN